MADALGGGIEYGLRYAGMDKGKARAVHYAVDDVLTLVGIGAATKTVGKAMAKGLKHTSKAVTRSRLVEGLDLASASRPQSSQFIHQHYGRGQHINDTLTHIANQNRAPFSAQRSANANRLYEDMRAVATGGSSRPIASSSSASTIQMSSSKGSRGSSSMSRGASSSSSSQGSASNARQGSSGGSSQPESFGRNILTGELEPKGKGVVRSSNRSKVGENSSTPQISRDHDRIAHDSYYTRKSERTQKLEWQQRIKDAQPANYIKHTKARSAVEAKQRSETGSKHTQYLPEINNIKLEKKALSKGIRVIDKSSVEYYFYKSENVVGYDLGKPTNWIRAELTISGTYHGHPMSLERVRKYVKDAS